jgi:hypothetical protein
MEMPWMTTDGDATDNGHDGQATQVDEDGPQAPRRAMGADNGEMGPTTTTTYHLPPASRATARGVDRGWNDDDDGVEIHNDELGRLQPPKLKVCFKLHHH